MKIIIVIFSLLFTNCLIKAAEIDNKLLKCLICRSTIKEIEEELAKIDPSRQIEIGNYRLDAQGNVVHKKIPLAQSEVHISDILDNICEKMSDYVRATYKSNGQLTILNLLSPSGGMNPRFLCALVSSSFVAIITGTKEVGFTHFCVAVSLFESQHK